LITGADGAAGLGCSTTFITGAEAAAGFGVSTTFITGADGAGGAMGAGEGAAAEGDGI
jgi:hypothetical protein